MSMLEGDRETKQKRIKVLERALEIACGDNVKWDCNKNQYIVSTQFYTWQAEKELEDENELS
jgi:hypothetical protein